MLGGCSPPQGAEAPVAPVVAADAPRPDPAGGKRLDALGGRLRVWMPEGARVEARKANLMAAAAPVEEESRLVFDDGPARLVVMAYEELRTAGDDFERAVRAEVEKPSKEGAARLSVAPFTPRGGGLKGLKVVPSALLGTDALLARAAFVWQTDGTVQYVAVYLNPEAAKREARFVELADQILDSLAAGGKVLDLAGGPRRVAIGAEEAAVTLPPSFVMTQAQGPDFTVYRLRKVGRFGQPGAGMGVYAGDYPSRQHTQRESDAKVVESKGHLLGREIVWMSWTAHEEGATADSRWSEAIVEVPGGRGPRYLHVWIEAGDAAAEAELRRVAEAIVIVPRAK